MKLSKNMESLKYIADHSAESKNFLPNHKLNQKITNSQRGLWAEKVVRDFLIQKKWHIISERKKYKFGEIDLVAQFKDRILLIEVKSLHNEWMSFERIQQKQMTRLKNNYLYLASSEFRDFKTELFACFVNSKKNIEWISLI